MFHFIARPKHIFGLSDLELIFGPVHIYMNIIDAFWTLNDPYLFNNTIVLETRSTVTTEKCILKSLHLQLLPTIWGEHYGFFSPFTLKHIPEFDCFVPWAAG